MCRFRVYGLNCAFNSSLRTSHAFYSANTIGRCVQKALDRASQGSHGVALVPPDVRHDLVHLVRVEIVPKISTLGFPMKKHPSVVTRRECVSDAEVEEGELAREADPAL